MADDTSLELSRVLNAPVARVWHAWTDPRLFEKWWVPRPWRAEVHTHDVTPGGGFEMTLHGPEGEQMRTPGCFLLVAHEAKIVFTSTMSAGFQPVISDFAFTAVITMQAEAEHTRYTARVLHPTPELCAQHAEMGFHSGWGAALDQLDTLLSAR